MSHFVFLSIFSTLTLSITSNLQLITFRFYPLIYNYVQVPMSGPRVAPTQENFRNSEAAFFEVIESLRPDIIIVWGRRLYNNLPKGGLQGDDLKTPDGQWIETWRYFLSDRKEVKVIPIMHPSSFFSPEFWHNFLSAVI